MAPSTGERKLEISGTNKSRLTPDLTRLPTSVIPKRYELKLDVEPELKSYTGQVYIRIFIEGDVSSNTIWLHSKNLDIWSASIQFSQFALPFEASEILEVPEKAAIGLVFDNENVRLPKRTRAWLQITFKGELLSSLEGFYSNPYVDKNGCTKLGAATLFAATEARSCFPCFDEPNFKAIFALEVTVDQNLLVISNMPVMDSEKIDSRRKDTFEWSKEMSTYLVCIVIGQYDFIQTKANNRTLIRVFTPHGQREQGRFCLEVAKKSLEFFNQYFGKRYPLPKLDLVALNRLSVGAMENWGLITCRENAMIVDPNDSSPSTLRKVATLIAHEISHQWFGNLVTMKWWDFLYLNEGFATFMQYLCINALYPEFEVFNEFSTETFVPALGMDALEHTHPVEVPLKDASEISQVFDKITYCKGASVIFMLHQFIGPEHFRTGIREYIQHFSYSNADTDDLWLFLSKASGRDVASLMNSWIREIGFPVVKVSILKSPKSAESGVTTLQFIQHRFCGGNAKSNKTHMVWSIPIQGIYMKDGLNIETFEILFDKKTTTIDLEGLDLSDPNCWLKLNPRLTGFYRVHYSEELFQPLFNNLSSAHLTSVDRMGLFDDQVAMVQTDSGSTVRLLKMAQHFSEYERSYTVWRAVIGIIHLIRSLTWENDEVADLLDNFCQSLLRPFLDELGFVPILSESANDKQCRGSLFGYLASIGDKDVQNSAKDMFKSHIDGSKPLCASMRDAVYRAVMVTANRQTFNQLKNLYRNAELSDEKNRILHAFGYCQDPNVLFLVLDFSMSMEVPLQDSLVTINSVASNRHGYKQAWSFFSNNLSKISKRYAGGLFLMSRLVKSVTENFSDMDSWREISDTFADNKDKLMGAETACEQACERIKLNAAWRFKDIDNLRYFLQSDEAIFQ